VLGLLEGKTVNLRVREKEDVDFLVECNNDIDFWGEYSPIARQVSKSEWIKGIDNPADLEKAIEWKRFIIQKKDGTRIGNMVHYVNCPSGQMEFGCVLVPSERGKGYGTEATQLMVDYLFLSKDIVRIQTTTNVANKGAQKTLKKAGFKIEGTIRKVGFVRGEWNDYYILSILREEWKEPKILTKNV
jgi:RimJ/RimL family protein N-acetyltransferase